MYCILEQANNSAVCSFASYAEAKAFKLAHIAHVDCITAHGASYGHKQGEQSYAYAGWAVVKQSKLAQFADVQLLTREQLIAQYAECYAMGCYSADGKHLQQY